MLSGVQEILGLLVREDWADRWHEEGRKIARYRDYFEGDHPNQLTDAMREMLRIDSTLDSFNMNYAEMVIDSMVDRLRVMGVEPMGDDDEAAREWVANLLAWNRFDELQIDVHEAALRDSYSMVGVWFDEEAQMPTLHFEEAWDGETGVIPIYDRRFKSLAAVVKIWYEPVGDDRDARRMNVYYPDGEARYVFDADGGALYPYVTEDVPDGVLMYPDVDGMPMGVPFVHFRNRAKRRRDTGKSAIEAIRTGQDVLNRLFYSMVATAELTAFGVRTAKGFAPPEKLAPGQFIVFGDDVDEPALLSAMDAGMMDQGEIMPFVEAMTFTIDKMAEVSRTPNISPIGESGEAKKHREVGLIGKIERFQVKAGNGWENVVQLAGRIQRAWGRSNPPMVERWTTVWKPAELRNDDEVSQMIDRHAGDLPLRKRLGLLSQIPAFNIQQEDVDALVAEQIGETAMGLAALDVPGFDNFNGSA